MKTVEVCTVALILKENMNKQAFIYQGTRSHMTYQQNKLNQFLFIVVNIT